jgi:Holliday junction resolvase RusA-like endonuclease
MEIVFTVPGEPRGKGRPRFTRTGRPYTDSETAAYERKIVAYYRKAHGAFRWPDGAFLAVDVVAYLPIPKSATRAQKAGMEAGMILPSRKPDVDNIVKVVLDALNGVAYKDDARVHRAVVSKYYGTDSRLEIRMKEAVTDDTVDTDLFQPDNTSEDIKAGRPAGA